MAFETQRPPPAGRARRLSGDLRRGVVAAGPPDSGHHRGSEHRPARPGVDPPAVVAGGFIYTSGLVGLEATGRTDQPDVAAEVRRALERLKTVVEAAGSSLAQVVSVTVYLRSPKDFDVMNAVYREFFAEKQPARTTVGAELAHGALVMISAVAVPNGTPREVFHPAGWAKSPRPYSYAVRAGDLVFLSGLVSRRAPTIKSSSARSRRRRERFSTTRACCCVPWASRTPTSSPHACS